jgi:H+/Cl- antiporter ClcA
VVVVGIAGVVVAVAIVRLPGTGGHQPSEGLKARPATKPIELPGLLLAALASVGLGMVLGPEAPLIGLGTGLGVLAVKLARKDAPDQVLVLMSAAAAFAAVSSLFGSPVVGAVIIIEATGLGGPTLPVILLPGLLAAGIGSLVFIGMGSITGLSASAYAIAPLSLPSYPRPDLAAFAWTVLLALVVAVAVFAIVQIGRGTASVVSKRPFVVIPVAALVVGGLAIAFAQISGKPDTLVLFSGQDAMGPVVAQAATLSLGTLALLIVFKGLAWGVSLGSARGGPTFPAMFLGVVAGLLAAHLPGYAESPAVAALMAAGMVSMLKLPLSSIIIALVICRAGLGTGPLIIVAVVVAYVTVQTLSARRDAAASTATASTPPAGAGTPDALPATSAP